MKAMTHLGVVPRYFASIFSQILGPFSLTSPSHFVFRWLWVYSAVPRRSIIHSCKWASIQSHLERWMD
ncbi:hypothetical protein L1987_77015 [Smallanthus sonchifolius]|uniref:Uncharacterized protein n=1 Tax=Smallanthus sonchifolius TaxID=185202 RepID=A0ACB8Z8K1_9ASTR|nr:hypothetical protein L1987_77015 [Smallanthus sonchifolius]